MNPRESSQNPSDEPASFEAALERLEQVVSELETGEIPLEKSLDAFEEAQRLITYCEKKLKSAEQILKQLNQDGNRDSESES